MIGFNCRCDPAFSHHCQALPTAAEAAAVGLRLGETHKHDSRPNSWCIRVGKLGGKRAYFHLQYDAHSLELDHRTVYSSGWWCDDGSGNVEALALIAARIRFPQPRVIEARPERFEPYHGPGERPTWNDYSEETPF